MSQNIGEAGLDIRTQILKSGRRDFGLQRILSNMIHIWNLNINES